VLSQYHESLKLELEDHGRQFAATGCSRLHIRVYLKDAIRQVRRKVKWCILRRKCTTSMLGTVYKGATLCAACVVQTSIRASPGGFATSRQEVYVPRDHFSRSCLCDEDSFGASVMLRPLFVNRDLQLGAELLDDHRWHSYPTATSSAGGARTPDVSLANDVFVVLFICHHS
jgi:hypothetical protein